MTRPVNSRSRCIGRLWVTGSLPEWISATAGVPQIAADLLQHHTSAAPGHERRLPRLVRLAPAADYWYSATALTAEGVISRTLLHGIGVNVAAHMNCACSKMGACILIEFTHGV
jgi:hypothetical protein